MCKQKKIEFLLFGSNQSEVPQIFFFQKLLETCGIDIKNEGTQSYQSSLNSRIKFKLKENQGIIQSFLSEGDLEAKIISMGYYINLDNHLSVEDYRVNILNVIEEFTEYQNNPEPDASDCNSRDW